MLTTMDTAQFVRRIRDESHLSIRDLADAAGVAASTVHRIETGDIRPPVDTLGRVAQAAGFRLRLEPVSDYAASVIGLARSIRGDLANGDETSAVRRAAEFAHAFSAADAEARRRMIAGEPPEVGEARWDAFLAALAEWLAVRTGVPTPRWTHGKSRYLHYGWWVTPMQSMHAWEYAGSPSSFRNRGVYVHRDSLVNV